LDGETLPLGEVLELALCDGQLEGLLVARLGRQDGMLDLPLHGCLFRLTVIVVATFIVLSQIHDARLNSPDPNVS
jgi:hypothetical protein